MAEFEDLEMKASDLIPYANNSRTHSEAQIKQVAASIREFGFTNPVLIDEGNGIIAGHGRVMAAELIKKEVVPCIRVTGWSEAQKKAYIIADNQIALNAGWNTAMLEIELEDLKAMNFDIDLIGFDMDFLDDLFGDDEESAEPPTPQPSENPVSLEGDVWILGRHRLMCGNSKEQVCIDKLMEGVKPDLVFTDPPYGISVVGSSKTIGGGKARNDSKGGEKQEAAEYAPVIGDDEDYDPSHIFEFFPDAKYILWGANYYNNKLPVGGRWFVWDKNRGEGTTFSDCELAWSNIKGVVVKKYKVTWDGMNREGESGKRVHPTQKPVLLSDKILRDFHYETVIVDLFGGSGATLLSCERMKRQCFMMELSRAYVDIIIERWQALTNEDAILAADGRPFKHIKADRC